MNDTYRISNVEMKSPRNLVLHGLYFTLYGFFKYLPFPFCNYLRWLAIRIFTSKIHTMHIMEGVTIFFPWRVAIGQTSSLNQGVIIDGFGGVTIGNGVRIAPNCYFNTADHAFDDPDTLIMEQGYKVASIRVEDDVWIGTGTVICKGVTVGRGAVVGAGAVITKDVPPYTIIAGVPGRIIGHRRNVGTSE